MRELQVDAFTHLGPVCVLQLYNVVRKEIWYRPDMFFFRDMLMMLARNKKVDEAKQVWQDLKREEVLFDQHTFGDIMRAFLDNGLIPFPELREQDSGDD
ncbi:hypothetical protein OIU85_014777 [Salix viminalis]|uniref:Pentatricopeptide repeat-containing protein n=1 Tax=Salix viminalis TaxID=40686 RepID=A0A9Q0NJT0_SALVM|nr:hypothetical protein OIU85_014777 [Salix viminalis]